MPNEIKKVNICKSSFFEGLCGYISLNEYAHKNSIKCTLVNIGDEIIPDKIGFDGTPYFSYNTLKKYLNGDPYFKLYFEIEYKSKKLELDESIFNSAKGITSYIKDLETLHHIINIRAVAYEKNKIKLKEFVWRGFIKLDQFGQVLILANNRNIYFPKTFREEAIPIHVFNKLCTNWSGSFKQIPTSEDTCPICGEKWTINNIHDYAMIEEQDKYISFHINCLKTHKESLQLKEFQDIFSNIYPIELLAFKPINNEYCSCNQCSPWFIVSTPDGDIKIGWRKRVINIDWMNNYKQFTEKFSTENVTKTFSMPTNRTIHANGIQQAINYLYKAKSSIIV